MIPRSAPEAAASIRPPSDQFGPEAKIEEDQRGTLAFPTVQEMVSMGRPAPLVVAGMVTSMDYRAASHNYLLPRRTTIIK